MTFRGRTGTVFFLFSFFGGRRSGSVFCGGTGAVFFFSPFFGGLPKVNTRVFFFFFF
jgi:hypothetical protein